MIADKAYSHPSTREAMRDRRIRFVGPERDDQIARRVAKGVAYYPAELTIAAIVLWLR
ncbi:hypothetical protein [Amycolatopsis lexingtonensis]|uniref:hypothetical protein n=1 Tax=Amycolatopsis lexingtonensis TaxID=218822 RepID=UPI003F704207